MIFLGETFFEEKGFPEPFPKTFSNKKIYKESADLEYLTAVKIMDGSVFRICTFFVCIIVQKFLKVGFGEETFLKKFPPR